MRLFWMFELVFCMAVGVLSFASVLCTNEPLHVAGVLFGFGGAYICFTRAVE